jgi:hypothetical protein
MKSRRRTQPSPARLRTTPVFEVYQIKAAMSALGQKPTYALQQAMSALHPIATAKADISWWFSEASAHHVLPSPINRAGFPTVAGQQRNLYAVDESALEGWIKVAHRLFIEVDDATRFQRPDIVYFNDGSLIGDFNKGVCGR